MPTGDLTLLESGVWLIPLALLAIVGALFLLTRRWQRSAAAGLKEVGSQLRRLRSDHRQLAQASLAHSPSDPPPYGQPATALHHQLNQLAETTSALEKRYVYLQEQSRWLDPRRWQAIMAAPVRWLPLQREITAFRCDLSQANSALAAASQAQKELNTLGWKVSQEARHVQKNLVQAGEILGQLRSGNLQGAMLEAALRCHAQLNDQLGKLPGYFLQSDEAGVLKQASKQEIIAAHETLGLIQKTLAPMLFDLQGWEAQLKETHEKVASLQRATADAAQALDNIPVEVDTEEAATRFKHLKEIQRALQDTLSRLEVENMGAVTQEAARLVEIAREIEAQLKLARQQQSALDKTFSELEEGLKKVALQAATLAARSQAPIAWSKTTAQLSSLQQKASAIGPIHQPRSPEQIEQVHRLLAELLAEQNQLVRYCQQVEKQQIELQSLLSRPEIGHLESWLPGARQLAEQIAEYSPENWSRLDEASLLPQELQALERRIRHLAPTEKSRPIPEAELPQVLSEARGLVEAYHQMHQRTEALRSRLSEIQATEQETLEELEAAGASLNQVALVIRSNDFLQGIAAEELGHLQSGLQDILDAFDQPEQGSVAKKAKQAGQWMAKTEQQANRWMESLNKEIQDAAQDLSAILEELMDIAQLDEPAMKEAERLLSSKTLFGVGTQPSRGRFTLAEVAAELKARSEFWQKVFAAGRALFDVSQELVEVHQQAIEARQAAQVQVDRLAKDFHPARSWPPTSISPETNRQEFNQVESQWQSIKRAPARAIRLVAQFGNLAGRYQALAEKMLRETEHAAEERQQVASLEADLEEIRRRWADQLGYLSDNPAAVREIRALLDKIAFEQGQLRRQFQQGSRNYGQVLQALKSLHRQASYYQVALDGDHAVDASGNISRRR